MPALPEFDTAGNVINRALIQLGQLGVSLANAPDPFASDDSNVLLATDLINSVGDLINTEHDWPQLRKECVITTVLSQNTYALPSDFHEMIDQSGWNRSARLPAIGPLSPQEWAYLKARALGMFITVVFRIGQGQLEVNPGMPISAGIVVAFEYQSVNWCSANGGTTAPDKDSATAASDLCWYDSELLIAALKVAWLTEKGFDTEKAEQAYEKRLEHCIGKSTGAPTLSLVGGGRTAVDRFIDNANLPLTGFGN